MNFLHKLFPVLAAFLFAFNGLLHPLFHAQSHEAQGAASEIRQMEHGELFAATQLFHSCPICSGLFSAADLPAQQLQTPEFNSESDFIFPVERPLSFHHFLHRSRAPPQL